MINPNLHKNAIALDREKHRKLKLDVTASDLSSVDKLNAFFVAAIEFVDACRDSPVVWVRAGQDDKGKLQVAPVAVFGVKADQNLAIHEGRWRVRYVPAMLRFYPFAMARLNENQLAVCIDASWPGLQEDKGEPLFDDKGEATPLLQNVQKQLEDLEVEIERTRLLGELLVEKGLLREMRFDATLPNGEQLVVDGFLTVDEDKLAKLSDAEVVDLHRKGVLGLIHAHQVSLGNMRRLVEWHAESVAANTAKA
jgi:hypothetical protein